VARGVVIKPVLPGEVDYDVRYRQLCHEVRIVQQVAKDKNGFRVQVSLDYVNGNDIHSA